MQLSDYVNCGISILRNSSFNFLSKLGDSEPVNSLSFLEHKNFIDMYQENKNSFSAIITTSELLPLFKTEEIGIAICEHPKEAFIKIHNLQKEPEIYYTSTSVGCHCNISELSMISPLGVKIGDNVIIEEYVKIFPGVIIGSNTVIRRGSIIGCEDYERCMDSNNKYVKSKHIGILSIGENVQIDENVSIDRPLFNWDYTKISSDSFVGRNACIAHGSKIGHRSIISPNSFICGNTVIGDDVKIGVGAIISSRITIGNNAIVSLGSVVNKDVVEGQKVTGNLAISHEKHIAHIKSISL